MSLFSWLKDRKVLNELWDAIEPFVINLAEKNVPKYITKLYENLAKATQPALDSLKKLKEKNAIETFANHLLTVVADLRK